MKKKLFCLIICTIFVITVYAEASSFTFNSSEVFNSKSKSETVALKFDQSYQVSTEKDNNDEESLKEFAKRATYYLLGPANNINETTESYIKRKSAFYELRYAPDIPTDADGNMDINSEEYAEDLFSGYLIPNIFTIFNDLEIVYDQINDVQIVMVDDGFYAKVTLLNVEMQVADETTPMNYKTINADIDIYYYFRAYKGEYKLYYMYGEYDNELKVYNDELSQQEYRGLNNINTYKSDLSSLYDYSKLNKLSNSDIKKIYNDNKENVIILNTMNNQGVSNAATGFFITENIAVTTWSYLEKSLHDGSYITITDGNGKVLSLEGIVTVDIDADYAVLKVTGSNSQGVKFGSTPNSEDVSIMISTKTGSKLSTNVGIVMSNEDDITNLISTVEYEEGAPVFNEKGQVVGMNSSKITNSYFSKTYTNETLTALQTKFKSMKYADISYVTFEELKEGYYVEYGTDKVVNELDKKIWNKYKKIGNLENTITLELVKASYKDGILSLRYKNQLSSIFTNMQLASAFTEQLIKDRYNIIVSDSMKQVYSNNKYRITIMSEFDYLIVVIAEM